jgi:DNA repair protein RadC
MSDSEVFVVETPLGDMLEASGIRMQTPNRAQFADEDLLACFVRVGLVRAPKWKPNSRGPKLDDRHAVALLLRHLADYDREHLVVVAVGADRRLLGVAEVHIGTVSQSLLVCSAMLRVPLLLGADGFYMAHNHPSGDPTSSQEDRQATKALSRSSECAGLRFLGSLVIAHAGYTDVETLHFNDWPKS